MKLPFATLLLIACFWTTATWAQCATGINTGGGNCTPPDAPGMPGSYNASGSIPAVKWADRWGAIAYDDATGDAGTIEGQESKDKAEREALQICSKTGSRDCKIIFAFHNQCAAVAFGGGGMAHAGAGTQKEAEQLAIRTCGHGDACKIVYSKCSMPERIK